jgi:alanyl-tRNA synthetase
MDSGLSVALGGSDLTVVDVLESGTEVLHIVEIDGAAPRIDALPTLPEAGWPVQGQIDWDRRYDLMQQHTGQHILSRAFEEVLGAKTVGFHLAKDYVSIDLEIQAVTPEDLCRVEDLANRVVFDDVPVVVREFGRGELPSDVRARFQIDADKIRVIYIGDFDACPCGGTHATSTGQIGLIKVNETDRAHGGVRVVFRCGGRALADYRQKQDLLDETARVMSQPAHAIPAAAKATVEKLQKLQEEYDQAQEALLEFEIEAQTRPDRIAGVESVVALLAGSSPDRLKYAAKRIAEVSGKLTVCFAPQPRFSAVVASLAPGGPDARAVVSAIAQAWGGRGGGTPQMAQLGSKDPLATDPRAVSDDIKRICREFK